MGWVTKSRNKPSPLRTHLPIQEQPTAGADWIRLINNGATSWGFDPLIWFISLDLSHRSPQYYRKVCLCQCHSQNQMLLAVGWPCRARSPTLLWCSAGTPCLAIPLPQATHSPRWCPAQLLGWPGLWTPAQLTGVWEKQWRCLLMSSSNFEIAAAGYVC